MIDKEKIAHLLYVPMTGLGLHNGYRGDEWLKTRLDIFKRFVMTALNNQSDLHFTLWFSWRPEERNNPLVIEFERHMNQIRAMSPVFTYEGLCFIDDKYPDKIAKERLLRNLIKTLPTLKQHVDHAEQVYLTIQPSDDLYLDKAVETIQNTDFRGAKAVGWEKGYIMNYATKELAEYNPTTLPPFSTIRFPKEVFLDPEKHMEWSGPYRSHEYVRDLGFKALPGRGFIVGCHGENISTTWNIPFKGKLLNDQDRDKVWLQAGIYFVEPLKTRPSKRLLLRRVFNLLPFNVIIRNIYHYVWKR